MNRTCLALFVATGLAVAGCSVSPSVTNSVQATLSPDPAIALFVDVRWDAPQDLTTTSIKTVASSHAPDTAPSELTVLLSGDTLIHLGVSAAAARHGDPYDYTPLFEPVREIVTSADLAICHLEVPLSPTGRDLSSFPLFNVPPQVATGLADTGFDGCSTASNHSYDQGPNGVVGTIDVLAAAGLKHSGTASREELSQRATMYDVHGVKVAHISATYWLNGLHMPEDSQWLVQLLTPKEVEKVAARASMDGADLVIVSMHCCVEYAPFPTSRQMQIARDLIASPDIDLVVAHHSHVVGPVERVEGEFIAHGLGNFVSGQTFSPTTRDGAMVVATARYLSGWRFTGLEVVPIEVIPGTYEVVPAQPKSASYWRTMTAVNAWGAGVRLYDPRGLGPHELELVR